MARGKNKSMPKSPTLNWKTGTWTHAEKRSENASILIAGDWAPIRTFAPIIENKPESIYGDLLSVIRSADLCVANLEAPLSDIGTPVSKSGAVFKGEKRHIQGLACVPFDAVTLANNHVFDFGLDAFKETLAVLDDTHIRHTGAGMDLDEAIKPLVLEANDITIGIINFSEGEDLTHAADSKPGVMGWQIDRVNQAVRELKKQVNLVLAISHCGLEYVPFPPPYVADTFRELARAGADLVIGHHPHVPQGISFEGQVPICHSLGNFVFYQETQLKFRKLGYMVKAQADKDGLASFEVIPYQIIPQGLELLKDENKDMFFSKLRQVSDPLNTRDGRMDSWNGFLDHYGQTGFFNEINTILEKMNADPKKGAAMFRNRLTTLQHYHHLKDLMTRIVANELGSSPEWARDLTKEWLTEKIAQ